jgi:hypothetical protein
MLYKCLYYIILIFNIYLNNCYCISSKYNNNILKLRDSKIKNVDEKKIKDHHFIKYIKYINNTKIKNSTNRFIYDLNNIIINDIKNITNDEDDNIIYKSSSSESLNIIDENVHDYDEDVYIKHKSLQRTVDIDYNYKIYFIVNKHKVIDIMNKWSYSNYNSIKLECIFKFLFIFFYINRNIKQVIGIFNIFNKCETLLFYEYRYINYSYKLYFVDKVINPLYKNIYNTTYMTYIDEINDIITNYDGCISNDSINSLINKNLHKNITNIVNNISDKNICYI